MIDCQQRERRGPGFCEAVAASFKCVIEMFSQALKMHGLQWRVKIAHHDQPFLPVRQNDFLQLLKDNRARGRGIRFDIDQQNGEKLAIQGNFEQMVKPAPADRAFFPVDDLALGEQQHLFAQKFDVIFGESLFPNLAMPPFDAGFDNADDVCLFALDQFDDFICPFFLGDIPKKQLELVIGVRRPVEEKLCRGQEIRQINASTTASLASWCCLVKK